LYQVYRRVKSRPDNPDDDDLRKKKESAVSSAFMAYLSSTGDFGAFREKEEDWIQTHVSTFFCPFRVLILSKGKDPFKAWEALSGSGLRQGSQLFANSYSSYRELGLHLQQ
jgi:hypothetical protein